MTIDIEYHRCYYCIYYYCTSELSQTDQLFAKHKWRAQRLKIHDTTFKFNCERKSRTIAGTSAGTIAGTSAGTIAGTSAGTSAGTIQRYPVLSSAIPYYPALSRTIMAQGC